jgi:hypothetical protein
MSGLHCLSYCYCYCNCCLLSEGGMREMRVENMLSSFCWIFSYNKFVLMEKVIKSIKCQYYTSYIHYIKHPQYLLVLKNQKIHPGF